MAVGNLTTGYAPNTIGYDSGKGELYVDNAGDGSFTIISDRTNSVVNSGYGIGLAGDMVYDSRSGEIFVTNEVSNLVNIINDTNNSVVSSVGNLGNNPAAEAYDDGNGMVYIANEGDVYAGTTGDTVSVIDGTNNTLWGNITVGDSPTGIAYDPAMGEIFVANSGSSNVSVINDSTETVVATISLANGPSRIVYDSGRREVFVADSGLSVISPASNTVVANYTKVPTGWQNLAYDGATGEILTLTDNTVTWVFDSNGTVAASVPVGKAGVLGSVAMAYDAKSGYDYVALAFNSGGDGRVALITTAAYGVAVKETGLPKGGTWYVNGTGGPLPTRGWSAAAGNQTTLWLVNGSYGFTLATDEAYAPNSSLLTIVESGGLPSSESVKFWPAFGVTFRETGLPYPIGWWVNVSGEPEDSGAFFASSIEEWLPNGTYSYSFGFTLRTFDAPGGSFTVAGKALTENATFSPYTYALSFVARGLPSGFEWYVNFTSGPYGSTLPSVAEPSGTGGLVHLINGSYVYRVSTNRLGDRADPLLQNLTESGGTPGNQTVYFGPPYNVTIGETGLPTGSKWSVQIGGQLLLSGTSSTFNDSLPNGTYNYSVFASNPTYYAPAGQFTVAGATASASISFGLLKFPVILRPEGLPTSAEWYVNATSGPSGFAPPSGSAGGGTNISLDLINGSYSYRVQTDDRDYSTAANRSFYVYGSYTGTVVVSFRPFTYGVVFDESGLPNGSPWQIWLNSTGTGSHYHSAGGTPTIVVASVNDSYAYRIGDVPGWHLTPTGGSYRGDVTVSGASPANVSVSFARMSYSISLFAAGLPASALWYVNVTKGPTGASLPDASAAGTSAIDLSLSNGTFSFDVATNDKAYVSADTGNVTVSDGTAPSWTATFTAFTYAVPFQESGLPSGTEWWMNVTGQAAQSSSSTGLSERLPNGSYSFSVATVDKSYRAASGTFDIHGPPSLVLVNFELVVFNVTFGESGLPSGASWSVTLAGTTASAVAPASIVFQRSNGTYGYTIGAPVGFVANPAASSAVVAGSDLPVPIGFTSSSGPSGHSTPAPSITSFTISPASVVLDSTAVLSVVVSGGSPPLSYQYVGLPAGCASANRSTVSCTPAAVGSVSVTAIATDTLGRKAFDNASLTVTARAPPSGTSTTNSTAPAPFWSSADTAYVAVAVVAVGAVVVMMRKRRPPVHEEPLDPGSEGGSPSPPEE